MRSKRSLSHLILTLSWCLKTKIRSRLEMFAPSYNLFFHVVQIIIQATARIARNTTRFSSSNWDQKLSSSTCWLGSIEAVSTLRRDYKTDELARSSEKCAQLFLLSHCCSEDICACLPGPPCNLSRKRTYARWARTRSSSRSPNLVPNSNASEIPPSTSCADPQEIRSGAYHYFLIQLLSRTRPRNVTGPRKVAERRTASADKRCFALQPTLTFSIGLWIEVRKGIARFLFQHRVLRKDPTK